MENGVDEDGKAGLAVVVVVVVVNRRMNKREIRARFVVVELLLVGDEVVVVTSLVVVGVVGVVDFHLGNVYPLFCTLFVGEVEVVKRSREPPPLKFLWLLRFPKFGFVL